ncbi:MAG: hypothetical protein KAR06_01685 [Deltaproteobacteria bacterium]|nr:hypothetical protein [Deltaproteobacteria bacterium]
MSNYHVKTITPNGRKASVIFHIPIPVENNSAGVALRMAVSQYIGTFKSLVPWIDAGEVTQLQNGELYEHSEIVGFLAADNNAQKQAKIDARYTALSTTILDKVRTVLKFWGKNRDV